jgi:hypothetical protein
LSNYNALIAAGIPEDEIGLVFPYDGTVNNGVGTLEFFKNTVEPAANLIVSSPFTGSLWIVNKIDTYLTPFYLDGADGIPSDVCGQCPTDLVYHNGSNALPVVGDVVFTESDGSVVYSNSNTLHMIDTVTCSVPSPTNKAYIEVDENGLVLSVSPCNCYEYAVPFIFDILGVIKEEMFEESQEIKLCVELLSEGYMIHTYKSEKMFSKLLKLSDSYENRLKFFKPGASPQGIKINLK